MRSSVFSRAFLALWLAVAGLAANAFEQRELGFSVIAATGETGSPAGSKRAFHVMPDGRVMAGNMGPGHDAAGGHTHKGHADCDLCGFIADTAAFTLASLAVMPQPPEAFTVFIAAAPQAQISAAPPPPYASRAPPSQML